MEGIREDPPKGGADERALTEMAVVENGSRDGRAERGGPRGGACREGREGDQPMGVLGGGASGVMSRTLGK